MGILDSKVPAGPLADKWTNHKNHIDLVNPANKRNISLNPYGERCSTLFPLFSWRYTYCMDLPPPFKRWE